jgi:CHAD domain-containing protein
MSFSFSRKDPTVQKGVRRIAQSQMDNALEHLRADLTAEPEAVHEIRKATKKVRGLLRLIRPIFDDARAEDKVLRDAARQISGLRDAQVMRQTFDGLAKALPTPQRTPLRRALDARIKAAAQPGASAEDLTETFAAFQARSGRWKLDAKDFDALEPGLVAGWEQSRKALKKAQKAAADPDLPGKPLHEWRKRVKRHWYQARLLEPIWPEMMAPHIAEVDRLTELLGQLHDFDVLLATLTADASQIDDAALEALRVETFLRRKALADDALPLGARLFAEPADALADRWARWWRLWRR